MYSQYGQAYGQDGYANYGAAPGFEQQPAAFDQPMKSPFARNRRNANLVAVIACLFIPIIMFALVSAVMTFSIRYASASLSQLISLVMLAIVGLFAYFAFVAVRRKTEGVSEPAWYVFIFVTSLLAWIIAYTSGKSNYSSNMKPFFDVQQLNVYASVDPSKYRGNQLMDAGRITFTPGSHLDLPLSMGFRNLDTYCVAPVVSANRGNASSSNATTYDFWAVGLNCCSGHAPDFHCGEYNNVRAISGLRLMREDHRAFFRLAVQQAEAAYGIQALHPIFMYWMQDPIAEVNAYQDDGYKYFILGLVLFSAAQLVLVVLAAVLFSKMYV